MYDFSKTIVLRTVPWGDKDSFGVKLGGGLISGMMGAAIANPADLVSTPLTCPSFECALMGDDPSLRCGCRRSARRGPWGIMQVRYTRSTESRGFTGQ